MAGHDSEAAAWAGMAFDASAVGLRHAIAKVLIDLRAVSQAGGDVRHRRAVLADLVADLQRRAAAIPDDASDPPTGFTDPTPHGMPDTPPSLSWGWP
jgi:hypothetical protein